MNRRSRSRINFIIFVVVVIRHLSMKRRSQRRINFVVVLAMALTFLCDKRHSNGYKLSEFLSPRRSVHWLRESRPRQRLHVPLVVIRVDTIDGSIPLTNSNDSLISFAAVSLDLFRVVSQV